MIEKCIFEVYNRDKKVFLPEFGAIIYSDFNDSVDFNDLLTFDDGKVVEEIQNQLSISEDEARKALEEHVQQIKDTLGKGKLHYFSGIGYLSKDDQGNYSIEKSKPVTETKPRKKTPEKKSSSTTAKSKIKTSTTTDKKASTSRKKTTAKKKEEEPKVEEPKVVPPVEELPKHENNVKEDVPIPEPEDKTPEPSDTFNSTDETEYDVEEDKSFVSFASDDSLYNEYDEKHEEEEKSNSSNNIIWIAIVVILLSVGSFYLYKTFFADPISDNLQLTASIVDNDIAKDPVSNTIASQTEEEITSGSENNSETMADNTETEASTPTSSVDPTDPDEQKTYSLILGSFKVESNADKYLRRLNSRGIVVDKFRGMNSFYFVGIEKIEGKSNAVRQLEELRQKEPSAWIYNVERIL